MMCRLGVAVVLLAWAWTAQAQTPEVIAQVQVHGNNATPEADVMFLAGVAVGEPFGPSTLALVRERLEKSGRFEAVDVRKRYASISDPSQISLVIVVDEHPVSIIEVPNALPGAGARMVRRPLWKRAMFMPIFDGEDGYGLSYGALVSYPDVLGRRSHILFPLTWGGHKRAAVELRRPISRGPIDLVLGGASLSKRTNPAFEIEDDRRRVWGRAERVAGDVRIGATTAWERVSFAGEQEAWRSVGADVTWDFRADPVYPRNAAYARAEWTRLVGASRGSINRTSVDARGYLGFIGQSVLVARVERQASDRSLPNYFKPLLGGTSSLRGYRAGAFVGDTRVNGTLEIRVPITSPMSGGKVGVSTFVDVGKSYDRPARFADAPLHRGIGAAVWFTATVVRFDLSVARSRQGDTRVNAGLGVGF